MSIQRRQWGALADGTSVDVFTLSNDRGMEACVASYGGIVTRLTAPDRNGSMGDVVLGFDSLEEYLSDQCYFGRVVGRVANRIACARFELDGETHTLDRNQGRHHLHGGSHGFHSRVWEAEPVETEDGPGVVLRLVSSDGDQGYPGRVECSVTYSLTADGLRLDFRAETDRPTVINMTGHGYFNLSGEVGTDCLGHELRIPAGRVLEMDEDQIPTGRLLDVAGTSLDFTHDVSIGKRIREEDGLLQKSHGYDHYYVLDDSGPGLKLAASVYDPVSGRGMDVLTTCPGVHLYSGNHIPEALPGKGDSVYGCHSGLCLEAQGFVDAPNQPGFPSVVLEPGQEYFETILYKFFVK